MESPYIIRGSNSGKNSIVVSQNPAEDNSITLYRSDGEEGAEFTYTTWLLIQNLEYKAGEWKHIFHKGNKTYIFPWPYKILIMIKFIIPNAIYNWLIKKMFSKPNS